MKCKGKKNLNPGSCHLDNVADASRISALNRHSQELQGNASFSQIANDDIQLISTGWGVEVSEKSDIQPIVLLSPK